MERTPRRLAEVAPPEFTTFYSVHFDLLTLSQKSHTGLLLGLLHLLNLNASFLSSETHVGGEGAVWSPASRVTGRDFFKHPIHLLEGQTLGLWDHKIDEDHTQRTSGGPNKEDIGTQVAFVWREQVRSDDTDDL